MKRKSAALILHDVRSAHNVGSLFRTSDALGIEKIYLTGYTPSPLDRFGRPVKEVAKTALGAEKTIPWEKTSIKALLNKLKEEKRTLLAIEQAENSVDYKKVKIGDDTVFLLGNEVTGISKDILKEMDQIVEIPMKGKKESLNVAIAGSVVLFRVLDR